MSNAQKNEEEAMHGKVVIHVQEARTARHQNSGSEDASMNMEEIMPAKGLGTGNKKTSNQISSHSTSWH